jgi:hypothetical protein
MEAKHEAENQCDMQTLRVFLSFVGNLDDFPPASHERRELTVGVEEGIASTIGIPLSSVRLVELRAGRLALHSHIFPV